MKHARAFHKTFLPAAVISVLVIVFGAVGFFVRGINFGLDYRPGLIEEIRIAPTVMRVTYSGAAQVTLDVAPLQATLVISGSGAENETRVFRFADYTTVAALAAALNDVDGVSALVTDHGDAPAVSLFTSSRDSNQLTAVPYALYASGIIAVSVDDIRGALSPIESMFVQQLGTESEARYQIRVAHDTDEATNESAEAAVLSLLAESYGADNVVVIRSDFIRSSYSRTIALQSYLLLAATVGLIWLYAAFRFHWDFALGAIIALMHDAGVMMTFIIWTQMEFTTMTVAALLTIVGYSINATIVILDRIRYMMPLMNAKTFTELVDRALTDTLSRSIITTVTTLFAVLALYLFTEGSSKDFAGALIVGLMSGLYSSLFISSGFISLTRMHWKPEYGIHHSLKTKTGVLTLSGGPAR
ncbi:MAG: protein translocase subunit SecF [Treponema sp.]|nr:protein translocase subunit SecF [Treponema sp.]